MLSEVRERPRRVAVGEFDGVHLGHREVIRGSDTVLTFEPHPLRVVRPEAAPKLLTSLEAKAELIEALGVDELVVIPFDDGFAHQTAEEFIDHILVERSAGDAGVGGGELPLRAPRRRRSRRCSPRTGGSRPGSCRWSRSTARSSPRATSAAWCWPARSRPPTRFLGAPFQLRGEVVQGDQRGRTLGFPTANLVPDEALVCPGHGIYAARTAQACAAVSIGVRPDVRHRPRAAGRGVPARLRRGPVRTDAPHRLPRAPARGAPVRVARGARRADATRRRAHARSCANESAC